jgi:hypothetical protein
MNAPSITTLKRLFAKSSNRCAFPDCPLPIVENSGTVTGMICHIKARCDGGPRHDGAQTDAERQAYSNLFLLCGRHSKIIDSNPKEFTVEILQRMKEAHEKNGSVEVSKSDAVKAAALLAHYKGIQINAGGHVMLNSPGAVQATTVTIKSAKKSLRSLPAPGSLGAEVVPRNYVKHLIDRYKHFASRQRGRRDYSHGFIYELIKRQFKADWERIPISRFSELVNLLQERIDGTQIGRINRSKGIKNYSPFEVYEREYGGPAKESARF